MDLRPPLDEIVTELKHRNPVLKDHLKSVKVVYKTKDSNEGHVSLWITSRAVSDTVLSRGEIYATGRRCRVTEPDFHREVKRCFRCQQYGHLLRDCRASKDVCGKCAGEHRTSSCSIRDPSKYSCSNCMRRPSHLMSYSDGKHQAGDRLCPEQLKALNRFKKNHGL